MIIDENKLWILLSDLENKIINRKCINHTPQEKEDIQGAAGLLTTMLAIVKKKKFQSEEHLIKYLTSVGNATLVTYLSVKYTAEDFVNAAENPYERETEQTDFPVSTAKEKLLAKCPDYKTGDDYAKVKMKLGEKMFQVDYVKAAMLGGAKTKQEVWQYLDKHFPTFKYNKKSVAAVISKIRREDGLECLRQGKSQIAANKILLENPHCAFKTFCGLMKGYFLPPERVKFIFNAAKKNIKKSK